MFISFIHVYYLFIYQSIRRLGYDPTFQTIRRLFVYCSNYYLIGRLKRVYWIPQYNPFSDDLSLLLSQEESVIRQLAAQKFRVELHQDFVKLQNLVLHFTAFGYRQPRAVQAHD